MAKAKQELAWKEIDPTNLPEHVAKAYREYKACYAVMKEARATFEGLLNEAAPVGMRIVCGYNFGKLSLALVEDERKPAKGTVGTLADFLASAQASGRKV